ncbi:MAG: DUF2911 domain-containing protein [bacterium]|nr:DUF2911 domain-containing protein [bacterium]
MSLLKRSITLSFAFAFVLSAVNFATAQSRPPTPRASQKSKLTQTVGTTDISVVYSRPAVKGRLVYGDWPGGGSGEATIDNSGQRPAGAPLVAWGRVWRTGADEATMFIVNDDVLINGQPLAAGTYSLHSVPGKVEWTFIFNKEDGQWGSFAYDATKDALRIKSKPTWGTDSAEFLTFSSDAITPDTATINLRWEKLSIPFTVQVKDVVGSTMTRLRSYAAAAKADEWSQPLSAAMWAKQNKQDADAAKWFAQAEKAVEAAIIAKPTFANYRAKSNILFNAGKSQEALAATEKAIEVGKAEKSDVAALEKRAADLKATKN